MRLAISIGDINGIGLELALRSHKVVKELCEPVYCVNESVLNWGTALLGLDVPEDFKIVECGTDFEVKPGTSTIESGLLSYDSFYKAVTMAKEGTVDGIVTLPINKESWAKAGVHYVGHTDALSDLLGSNAIMMLGCEEMFVILYTHHIPLKDVSKTVKTKKLLNFFLRVEESLHVDSIAVLGLNPHAGDNGVIGNEDFKIKKAIKKANEALGKDVFVGPLVPDTAFVDRSKFKYYVCMYHDQGLIPLKTLYFEESINVSLDAGIIRTSVDHGTAFDIAYKNMNPSNKSYINAVKEAVKHVERKDILIQK
jgi:4-hydroxythreonine-4-phosphate dehydrogenase